MNLGPGWPVSSRLLGALLTQCLCVPMVAPVEARSSKASIACSVAAMARVLGVARIMADIARRIRVPAMVCCGRILCAMRRSHSIDRGIAIGGGAGITAAVGAGILLDATGRGVAVLV